MRCNVYCSESSVIICFVSLLSYSLEEKLGGLLRIESIEREKSVCVTVSERREPQKEILNMPALNRGCISELHY